jgi:hypothetical protein
MSEDIYLNTFKNEIAIRYEDFILYPSFLSYPYPSVTINLQSTLCYYLNQLSRCPVNTAHQTTHFGLCTALISRALALIWNWKCIA